MLLNHSKGGVKPSKPGKLSPGFSAPPGVRVNGVEHCSLLPKISSEDPGQSRLNPPDNFFRLLRSLALAQATLASHGPCFSNLLPNSPQFSASLTEPE